MISRPCHDLPESDHIAFEFIEAEGVMRSSMP